MSDDREAAVRAAMRAELGNSRLEDLPMEDGEGRSRGGHDSRRVYNHPPALAGSFRPVPVNKKWGQAIERGAFEDDDAVQVAGMDSMANGNLARQRRAGALAYNHVSQHFTEKSLRRDQNGHVAPRTGFAAQGRANGPVPVKIHLGNGPIDVEAALRSAPPAGAPRGPASSRRGNGPTRTQPRARTPLRPVVPQPSTAKIQTASPSAAIPPVTSQTQSQAPQAHQDAQPASPVQMRMVLPDGASIFLQLSGAIQSTAFQQRKSIPGSIFLITGRDPSEDMIVFAFEDKDLVEVRHRISEYIDHMTRDKGLMLLFIVNGGSKLYYAVVFEDTGDRDSFVSSLQKLVDRSSTAAEVNTVNAAQSSPHTEAPQPVIKIESLEPTVQIQTVQPTIAAPEVTMELAEPQVSVIPANNLKSEQSSSIPTTAIEERTLVAPKASSAVQETKDAVEPQVHPAAVASASTTQQSDPTVVIEPGMIGEMVTWVMNTTSYMRDCAPEDLSFDTIRAIIRATAAAVVVQYYPKFHQLSAKLRAQIVEVQCRPAVERGFLRELARNPALMSQLAEQDADDKDAGQITTDMQPDSQQQDAEVLTKTPPKPSPPKYEMEKLVALRGKAVTPPHWLHDIDGLKETLTTIPAKQRPSRHSVALDGPSHPPIPSVQNQLKQASNAHMNWLHPSHAPVATDTQPSKTVGDPFGDVSQLLGSQEGQAVIQGNKSTAGGDLPDDIATFLAGYKPPSQKKAFPSPPSGMNTSWHNNDGIFDHAGQDADHFPIDFAQGPTCSQELSSLFGNDLNQRVAQTTEDLRKLSLGN